LKKVVFSDGQKAESYLKLTLQFAFSVGQVAENGFKVTFDILNNRFIDFIQIAFWTGQEQ